MVTTNDSGLAERIRRFANLGYAAVTAQAGGSRIPRDVIQVPRMTGISRSAGITGCRIYAPQWLWPNWSVWKSSSSSASRQRPFFERRWRTAGGWRRSTYPTDTSMHAGALPSGSIMAAASHGMISGLNSWNTGRPFLRGLETDLSGTSVSPQNADAPADLHVCGGTLSGGGVSSAGANTVQDELL